MAEKKVYFNKPQRLTQLIGANTTVIVAGRRTGNKSDTAKLFLAPQATSRLAPPNFRNEKKASGNFLIFVILRNFRRFAI